MSSQTINTKRWFSKEWLLEQKSLIALLVLIAVVSSLSPNFFTLNNMFNILQQTSVNAIMAVGMTLDLSVVLSQPLRILFFAVGLMAITEGLKDGERVVTEGGDRLQDGMKVQRPGAQAPRSGASGPRSGASGPRSGASGAGSPRRQRPVHNP